MTIPVVSAWLAWSTRQAAAGLRCAADLVESLAEGLDGNPAPPLERPVSARAEPRPSEYGPRPVESASVRREEDPRSVEEDSRPLSGTRERIASTLDRARERYEATLAAGSDPTTKRRNS